MSIGVKLQRLRREDFIWVIYLFIAIMALVSDYYERQFLFSKNKQDQNKFRYINMGIAIVDFFIYLYFILINYEDITVLRNEATKKEVIMTHASFIAALLFLLGGIITLFVEFNRGDELPDIGLP